MKTLTITSLIFVFACATKTTEPTPIDPPPTEESSIAPKTDPDCPPGVKTDCNVPTLTQAEIDKIQEANRQCVADCVSSRQAEAMAAQMIQDQCQNSCDQKHFVGQVQIEPVLNELESGPAPEENEEETQEE